MHYFDDVKLNDKVYSLIFGLGKVCFIVDPGSRIAGFHSFEVEYENKHRVFYTDDGVPNWCNAPGDCQTIWYTKDIDLLSEDFSSAGTELTKKKILKLKLNNKLEMRCPSGIWRNVKGCPERVIIEALANERYHLFRKENPDDK